MKHTNIKVMSVTAAIAALGLTGPAVAADWVMAQAMEPPTTTHKFFGVLQASYTNMYGCDRMQGLVNPGNGSATTAHGLLNGFYNALCRVGPELHDQQSDFNLDNLAIGLRGNLIPGKINYFLMANAGMNAANYQPLNTSRAQDISLTDATMTFSYIPGVRVRAGLMRKPGPEELYQAVDANSYMWPTDFIARVQTEKFVRTNTKGTTLIPGQNDGTSSFKGYDADAGRDWGIQFFDAFKVGKWTNTYAVMVGNGSGIHDIKDYNSEKDVNLYFSSEYDLPGGKGPNKHGIKLYGYHQQGTRNFEVTASGNLSQDFDFTRHGFGVKALGEIFGEGRGKHRLGLDLMYADGMIFYTPTGNLVDGAFGGQIQIAAEKGNKARGITLDYGYYLSDKWNFGVRYAQHDVLYSTIGNAFWSASDKRIIKQLNFAVNYLLSPATRLTFNLEPRTATAPNPVTSGAALFNARATSNANIVTGSVGGRFGLQLTHQF
ncbi:MAG: hypothetical protein K9K30_16010 [Burkholderiaceae bacterium]|nr:hypothetical protein [Sulfuritalea sp.]MCF8176741.1 hypothetical protein [Burkholderiaceae bacterium]MCF8184830.1 hypothetical protein [Polynucleobacter sp.]